MVSANRTLAGFFGRIVSVPCCFFCCFFALLLCLGDSVEVGEDMATLSFSTDLYRKSTVLNVIEMV